MDGTGPVAPAKMQTKPPYPSAVFALFRKRQKSLCARRYSISSLEGKAGISAIAILSSPCSVVTIALLPKREVELLCDLTFMFEPQWVSGG